MQTACGTRSQQPPPAPAATTAPTAQQGAQDPAGLFSPPGILRQQRRGIDPSAVPVTPGAPAAAAQPTATGISTGLLQTLTNNLGGLLPVPVNAHQQPADDATRNLLAAI